MVELTLEQQFETFWKLYPARNGVRTGKQVAKKAFMKLKPSPELCTRICAAVLWFLQHDETWQKDNGNFIPMGSTFLNQKRWEDAEDTVGVTTSQVAEVETKAPENNSAPDSVTDRKLTLRQKYIRFRGINCEYEEILS